MVMDIKMMHEMIEKLTECAKAEMDKKGIEEIDAEEFGKATDIIKDLAEAMYYRTLTEAMKESEYGEEYDEYGPMDDGRRGYRGQPRSKTSGRYMKRGDGRRMGYDEPPYYHMNPTMYHEWDKTQEELDRDMDRLTHGRMYFTDTTTNTGSMHNANGMRDRREGRSGMMRRGYMEAKEMGKDKGEKMKELEDYMKELSTDVTEMIDGASPEEKTMLKQKMQVLMSKIQ
jgi:hypothetical protein